MTHKQDGYVALLVVLIVGTASLAIVTALLIGGTDSQRMTLAELRGTQARNLNDACAEEGLQVIRDDGRAPKHAMTFPKSGYVLRQVIFDRCQIAVPGTQIIRA